MYTYLVINSDSQLSVMVAQWKQQGIKVLAMDFEGEFNLHIYGEHLCLIQLYDGSSFYLIDPFKVSPPSLKAFLEDSEIEKIMFDCASDSALVRKEFGIFLENIYDIRVPALAIGYTGNLSGLVEKYLGEQEEKPTGSKKKNQMTNWLSRPLKDDQVQYALSDVAHLFALKEILQTAIEEKGLAVQVAVTMKTIAKPKGPDKPGWTKFASWKFLGKEEKIYLKHFFIVRDTLARKYNVPAVRILDKHILLDLAKNVPSDAQGFQPFCYRSGMSSKQELVNLLLQARENAVTELQDA
ncbi:3'-5' exonuclease [uncultured Sphaerochaeta sp.]|uniref:3'-5' exonuclease n=1 Tax=uncultured Sphaerochaeta sp. TaxID=886478 RepID=UPI002A0A43B6|nr:3'-5' exonuclease [uncultured Sphaerochaeta sp.]